MPRDLKLVVEYGFSSCDLSFGVVQNSSMRQITSFFMLRCLFFMGI